MNPLLCESCGGELESDDAISIIEGVCYGCRKAPAAPPHRQIASAPQAGRTQSSRPSRTAVAPAPLRHHIPPHDVDHPAPSQLHIPRIEPSVIYRRAATDYASPPRHRKRRRDLLIGATAGLLVTLGVTGYLLRDHKSLRNLADADPSQLVTMRLAVSPAWAEVTLDGRPVRPADDQGLRLFALNPVDGDIHWLEISADGFSPIRRPVSAISGVEELSIALLRLPYDLIVRSEPAQSEVWINDQLKGYTPLKLSMLPDEEATLSLRRQGFNDITQRIEAPALGGELAMDFALQPSGILLHLTTEPSGALIELEGEPRGASPLDVSLDPDFRGKKIRIAASLPGFETAQSVMTMPEVGGSQPIDARLTLKRTQSRMAISTDPPGAEVIVDGRALGPAPVVAHFDPTEVGRRAVIEARLAGSQHGLIEARVPETGELQKVVVRLASRPDRIVFVLLLPSDGGADGGVMTDHLTELIHRLDAGQKFAVVFHDDGAFRAWPEASGAVAASSMNKIRAYDAVRSVRAAPHDNVAAVLESALEYEPNAVWLLAGGNVDQTMLEGFGDRAKQRGASVSVVRATSGEFDGWLASWARSLDGDLVILGQRPSARLAGDAREIP